MGTDLIQLPAVIPANPADFADVAERIRGREQAIKDGFVAYIHNGADLIAVKDRLKHGEFQAWCEAEFTSRLGWSQRTIQRFMAAATHFGDRIEAVAEHRISKGIVYAVATSKMPEPARASLVEKIARGENVSVADIKAVATSPKKQAALTPEGKAVEERRRKVREARLAKRERDYDAENAAREAEREQAADILARMIVARLGDDADRFCEAMSKAYDFQVRAKVRAALAPPPAPPTLKLPQPMPEDVASVAVNDREMRKAEFRNSRLAKLPRYARR